ncbi:MAG TPA: hypothetical protein VFG30_01620 [Polyangiales bacterium]|nr:hypothetical protein [Polyangiales bacterium]
MTNDPIHGATIRWSFEGAMAGKTFEHTFSKDGTITYRMLGGNSEEATEAKHSEIARVSDDVWAISYLGSAGYTLTVVLDFDTHTLVSFASNEKELSQQTGSFEVIGDDGQPRAKRPAASKSAKPKAAKHAHAPRSH